MTKYAIKAIDTSMGIDGPAILKGNASRAKAWLVENRKSKHRREISALLAKLGVCMANSLLGRMMDLEQRLAGVEKGGITKSLDLEAYDSMAEMAQKLEEIERRLVGIEDRGWRYRGYWRQGMEASRNDAVTHNGSMFMCLRDTTETPDSSSNDWNIIARKGRDGKDAR